MFENSFSGVPKRWWLAPFLPRYFTINRQIKLSEVAHGLSRPRRSCHVPLGLECNDRKASTQRYTGQNSISRKTASFLSDRQGRIPCLITEHAPAQAGVFPDADRASVSYLGGCSQSHTRMMKTMTGEPPQPDDPHSSCGLSYSQFVRKCSECLTDRQLERVAVRLKSYKGLKKAPRPHNKLAVVRDIGKIIPQKHRAELVKLLSESLDLVDPHHFLRLSKATAERICTQDEVGDGIPQSIMGDYTVGAQLLRSRREQQVLCDRSRMGSVVGDSKWHSCVRSTTSLAEDSRGYLREIATRPPTPTRLTEKRIGELVVDWQDLSIPLAGTRSKNLVFLSNLPHAPPDVLRDVLRKAFSGCGKIVKLDIFDDRLRTLDQTEENTMQAKGDQAIRDKLEGRFSPIFALAEFNSTQEKQRACSTYLRTFGVPCIDRLVYPEDAAVKTTLVATNMPFILTPDEIARILAFALVHDAAVPSGFPAVCRIRMTNPGLYGYDQVFVEARSDATEPFFLLPLYKKMPPSGVTGGLECNTSDFKRAGITSSSQASCRNASILGAVHDDLNEASTTWHSNQFLEDCETASMETSKYSRGKRESLLSPNIVSASSDENLFLPRTLGPSFENGSKGQQHVGDLFGSAAKEYDLGRHVVKKFFVNRLVLNNDGMFVLRFGSFEAAEAAVLRCRGAVIYDTKALLLFSPRRCVYHNGQLVDFVVPEGNFVSGAKPSRV